MSGYSYFALNRDLPPLQPNDSQVSFKVTIPGGTINWPATGQSAVGVVDTKVLQTHGEQNAVPIASVAKVVTALAVLEKKPFTAGKGSSFLLSDKDVALYNNYLAVDGSVLPVRSGETMTEYEAIEAIMLPSANNVADSLAIWAFGSLPDYSAYANKYISSLGLKDTHIGTDASGFSPTSTSTAHDLVIIGEQAMKHPILREIVAKETSDALPGGSSAKNVNFLLGSNHIVGIKTGNTDQAGGVYLSASTIPIDNEPTTIITAYAGAPTLFQALQNSLPLIRSAQNNFGITKLLQQQAVVGEYKQPWGGTLSAEAQTNLTATAWRGTTAHARATLKPINLTARTGQIVGTVSTTETSSNRTNIMLATAPTQPSVSWRLMHPY